MIIFKQPFIGEGLSTHHDATYLYVDPVKMVGFWIPLQDATVENCCLEFVPGSHKCKFTNVCLVVLSKLSKSRC